MRRERGPGTSVRRLLRVAATLCAFLLLADASASRAELRACIRPVVDAFINMRAEGLPARVNRNPRYERSIRAA